MMIVLLVAAGIVVLSLFSALLVASDGDDKELEDREQEEYLRKWNERNRKKKQ